MRVTIRLFAALRENAGAAEVTMELPQGSTAAAAAHHLCGAVQGLSGLLQSCAVAVNGQIVPREHRLSDGDQVAFLPPVSGG
jgi:molybdopterin synthase catalytic subunit